MGKEELNEKIVSTIVYYDVLNYPLTSFEIWKYLLARNTKHETHNKEKKTEVALGDIVIALENEEIKKYVGEYRGYYFLKGRKDLAQLRIERNKLSEIKFKKILSVARWLRFIPFIRMIGVTGRVAMKNAEAKSDLDLLIVLEKGFIFTGRFLVTVFVHLLGKRRHGKKITDRICLNYYIATGSLSIDLKDLFSSSEYFFMLPIFGEEVWRNFQKENSWIKNFRENYYVSDVPNMKMIGDSFFSEKLRRLGEKILGRKTIEEKMKKFQLKKIKSNPKTKKRDSMIIADDDSLVFLPDPQGPKVYGKFRKKMNHIGILD